MNAADLTAMASADVERLARTCRNLARICGRCARGGDWPAAAEAEYAGLFGLIRAADRHLWPRVLADGRIPALRPRLYTLRAAFESDAEFALARVCAAPGADLAPLRRRLSHDNYWAAAPALLAAVSGARRILIAGAGALPVTALALAGRAAELVCAEIDTAACTLGEQLVCRLGYAGSIRYLHADVRALDSFKEWDCVVAPALLGVPHAGAPGLAGKTETLAHIADRLTPASRLVVRDPRGLGTLLYPPAAVAWPAGLEIARYAAPVRAGAPKPADIVVVRRR